ncbi:DUF6767 domain-containing protein [Jatrophihabitans sp.]|uniref:DUF6767 domain-containing protein n=1 Tax=Jatrophihabitans sp. TaxID=1932789 RepID=UPI002F05B21D
MSSNAAVPQCPLRPGQACTPCLPGATGPQDCGAVYLVFSDPDLRAELHRRTIAGRENRRGVRV